MTKPEYTDYVSTRWYRAPELLVGDVVYGPEVDVWAAGCLFAEIFNGMPLFPGDSDLHTLEIILSTMGNHLTKEHKIAFFNNQMYEGVRIPKAVEFDLLEQKLEDMGETALDLLRSTLFIPPTERSSASKCMDHPYFASFIE